MEKVIRIFLVEDDRLDQIQVMRAFQQKGILFSISIFNDGESAINSLLEEDGSGRLPDIVLLDINMPRMNGVEFLNEVRKHDRLSALKIFILTNSEQEKQKCESLGVSGYILKPFRLNSPSMDTISLLIDVMNI